MPEGLVSTELEDDRMPGMVLLAHLEQLRACIFRSLGGLGVAFIVSLTFSDRLWLIVSTPAIQALTSLGMKNPGLVMLSPMDGFGIVWIKLPMLTAVFMASPWIVYQIWRFITPALPKQFRSMAAPFVFASAGLFITGGLFAYFVVFRFGLTFLLGIGVGDDITQRISIVEYFDLFVNVILGVGLVFEMPVVIFCLTLLRIASPAFLLDHSRYAILIITIIAAIVTPTPDVFNLMLFAVPMVLLYFVGVFASYLLVLRREGKGMPWRLILGLTLGFGGLVVAIVYVMVRWYGFHLVPVWPFVTR
jgi:sec-independent protein translocase protein TatC